MNKLIAGIVCAVSVSLFAETQVYRLELDTETDTPSIVGQDGVKRQVCLLEPEQYALMTGRLARVWASLNGTHDGRVKLHGKKTETIIDTNTLTKVDVYLDGYRHVESFSVRNPVEMKKFAGVRTKVVPMDEKPKGMDERRWKMRQAYIRRLQNKAKEVYIEHNAATGKDEVK